MYTLADAHPHTLTQEEDAHARVLDNFFKQTPGVLKVDFESTMEVDIDGELYVCPPDILHKGTIIA